MILIEDDYGTREYLSSLEHEILRALVDQRASKDFHTIVRDLVAALPAGLELSTSETLRRAETMLWLAFHELDDVYAGIPPAPENDAISKRTWKLYEDLYDLIGEFVELQNDVRAIPEQSLETFWEEEEKAFQAWQEEKQARLGRVA